MNLGENILTQNHLIFLINAAKIDVNSYDPIKTICKGNSVVIIIKLNKYFIILLIMHLIEIKIENKY